MLLMRQLAELEGYADRLTVTEKGLSERGLDTNGLGEFIAIVAQSDWSDLWGYAVVYLIPFTYDLKPTLVLKELLVIESARGRRVGHSIMQHVVAHAKAKHCRLMKWDVLPSNVRVKNFYRRWDGIRDVSWENWIMHIEK
jgi:ribosomal protein S18 acetylase RimI-like enzyme